MSVGTLAMGTRLELESGPFAVGYVAGRALCSDGVVRALKRIGQPDTFFSIPASVTVKGRTVSGFVTVETLEGWDTASEDDPAVVKFIAYQYGANADALPRGAYKRVAAG